AARKRSALHRRQRDLPAGAARLPRWDSKDLPPRGRGDPAYLLPELERRTLGVHTQGPRRWATSPKRPLVHGRPTSPKRPLVDSARGPSLHERTLRARISRLQLERSAL